MNRKVIVIGTMLLVLSVSTTAPVFAETSKDAARIEKLEERTLNLEARMAKAEAASNKQMGMMQGHDMMQKGQKMGQDMMQQGMNNPMGQVPQQVPQQQNQPPAAGMQQGGAAMPPMGDM